MNLNLVVFIQEIFQDEAYVINIDEYKSIEMHWIALYVNSDNVTYVDSVGIFQKKYRNSQATKISQQIFLAYKQMIQ